MANTTTTDKNVYHDFMPYLKGAKLCLMIDNNGKDYGAFLAQVLDFDPSITDIRKQKKIVPMGDILGNYKNDGNEKLSILNKDFYPIILAMKKWGKLFETHGLNFYTTSAPLRCFVKNLDHVKPSIASNKHINAFKKLKIGNDNFELNMSM